MRDPYGRDPRLKDFRVFLWFVWSNLGLPEPDPIQNDIAQFLQKGPDRIFIEAFRGIGKSWITAAYVVWRLYWNPDVKILVVSQAKKHADEIATFILQIIHTVPGFSFLSPGDRERSAKNNFDVGPARPHKQPSVSSQGITGALTGSRADIILADDIESLNNSLTPANRAILDLLTRQFEAILSPGGLIVYLGTPQTDQSIYKELPERGYLTRIWPAMYPDQRLLHLQGNDLAPSIREAVEKNPLLAGTPTEPRRFGALELAKKRVGYGPTGFALQFLLDTAPNDELRYPLRLRDLIIMSVHPDLAPEQLIWSNLEKDALRLPSVGMAGDRFYGGIIPDEAKWVPYQGTMMYVDPAGTGTDETAFCVMKQSHGRLFVPELVGLKGGYSDSVMVTLATRAKMNNVNLIKVEANFGDGMFEKLLQPHLARIHPCMVESVKVNTQKERRIADTLEPIMAQHRLIIDKRVIENDGNRDADSDQELAPRYRLFYQMTRLTRDRGALLKDDRIDCLAGAAAHWIDAMAKDIEKSVVKGRNALNDAELKEFMDGLLGKSKPAKGKTSLNQNVATRSSVARPSRRDPRSRPR